MKITAVIPIKMNNERLPGKNTKNLGNKPLVQYIQETLLKADRIDDIYVFCSDIKIKQYLLTGVDFLCRDKRLDLPTSNFTQIFTDFKEQVTADVYVYAHATAPYITVKTVNECIGAVCSGEYDSAFCASKIQDFLWQDNAPLNFDPSNLPRSQDLNPIYRETSGVYVYTKEVFEKYHRRIGEVPFIKEVSFRESVDINNPADFELAEILCNTYPKQEML